MSAPCGAADLQHIGATETMRVALLVSMLALVVGFGGCSGGFGGCKGLIDNNKELSYALTDRAVRHCDSNAPPLSQRLAHPRVPPLRRGECPAPIPLSAYLTHAMTTKTLTSEV